MALVIDASVGLKWLLAEDDSYIAQALAVSNEELLAPDFWLNEACNIMWLQVRRNVFTASEAEEGLALLRAQVEPTPTASLRLHDVALEIALALDHSPYDTLYAAFAIA
ncbi:MAG: type II toxin-antitoxin system VapC family toxin, partial [Acetobacteraceae bacterium]|nr:type II toxin-antitoxin system VapC family toxin [Acetobacteraceae bacterium]